MNTEHDVKILQAQYVKSIVSFKDRTGFEYPEICFIGRSNVGKSSMINRIVMQKIAKTSSTPGATKMINIYKINYESKGDKKSLLFSDFPGFGYSKVSKKVYLGWQEMIEGYIETNKFIKRLIWVYDVRRDIDDMDNMLIEWMRDNQLSFSLALTKIDKISNNDVSLKRRAFQRLFGNDRIFLFSAKDGKGREELLSHIFSVAE